MTTGTITLGLDPGLATTGYGVVRAGERRWEVLAGGIIETPKTASRPERLREIYEETSALIKLHHPIGVAIEEVYFSTNVRTAMLTAEARGVLMLASAGLPVRAYSPLEVKKRITGYGRATKGQVQATMKQLLRLPELPRPDDVADGLALALCYLLDLDGLGRVGRGDP
jgi:crossover junction endodeoxyribonuclease RuvC